MKSFLNIPSSSAFASTFILLADLSERAPLTSELRLFTYRLVTICVKRSPAKTRFALTSNTLQSNYGLYGYRDMNCSLRLAPPGDQIPIQGSSRVFCSVIKPSERDVYSFFFYIIARLMTRGLQLGTFHYVLLA
jgi:hypothetical protein